MSPNSSLLPCKANDDHRKQKCSDQNVTNGNVIIPLDLVEQILLNLDAKTLFKYAFLCRDWNYLITSHDFISRNTSRQTLDSKSQVLLIDQVCNSRQRSFSLYRDNDQFDLIHMVESPPIFNGPTGRKVVGLSNGLVCLTDLLYENFALWNPMIRKYVTHPTPLKWDGKIKDMGFGFDDRINDFKVIYLVKTTCSELIMAWVFSYVTWSWKCLTAPPPPCQVSNFENRMFFMNGALHCIAFHNERYEFVLTLDVASEVFGEISLPESIKRSNGSICIVQIGDSLAVVHTKRVPGAFMCWSVWVMKQYGAHDSWTNVVNLREDHFFRFHDNSVIPINLLAMKKNQDMILETRDRRIVRYNPTTTTIKLLRQAITRMEPYVNVLIYDYAESLYLLEKGGNVNSY